jgi:hypothetical protein
MNPTYNTQSTLRASTGILSITTQEPTAIVSISQQNKEAAFLGKGDVSARLKPGDYLVTTTLAGDLATATVHITAGKTTSKRINPVHTTPPPSAATLTSFLNFDVLVSSGLTSDQGLRVKKFMSDFASTAKIVSVDPESIIQLPHDPADDFFQIQFTVNVDDVPYSGRIQYVTFGDVILTLTNANGQQVYSSEPAETTGD